MNNIKVEIERSEDKAVIHLQGLLDAHNAVLFSDALNKVISEGLTKIVVNFENLEYLGSSGLEVILSKVRSLRDKGGDIRLAGMSPKILRIFDLLGLSTFFKIFGSADEATKSF
ncbi:MAG: STAS domain-containing protein [Acidobacteriota bacterium]|nr:STAS domain-containing protein [Thermoanaerobaculaceae bacterium]